MDDPEVQERAIHDLEKKIDRLRALYDQYFLGLEKLEPTIPRKDVERSMRALRKEYIRNTALRFRFQQQVQRYNTLGTYWMRIARQIEEGTYRRDVMRAKARAEQQDQKEKPEEKDLALPSHEIDLDEFDDEPTDPGMAMDQILSGYDGSSGQQSPQPSMEELLGDYGTAPSPQPPRPPSPSGTMPRPPSPSGVVRQPPPPPREAVRKPPPAPRPAPAPGSLSADRMQHIYKDFVAARQRCNESVKGLSYDRVKEQLKTREANLRKKHGRDVDFEVTIKGGKAVLRAVPKG